MITNLTLTLTPLGHYPTNPANPKQYAILWPI